jgi:hypothetical protein
LLENATYDHQATRRTLYSVGARYLGCRLEDMTNSHIFQVPSGGNRLKMNISLMREMSSLLGQPVEHLPEKLKSITNVCQECHRSFRSKSGLATHLKFCKVKKLWILSDDDLSDDDLSNDDLSENDLSENDSSENDLSANDSSEEMKVVKSKQRTRKPIAYDFYRKSVVGAMRAANPNAGRSLEKMIGNKWKGMTNEEKIPFIEQAAAAAASNPTKPRRVRSAWNFFMNSLEVRSNALVHINVADSSGGEFVAMQQLPCLLSDAWKKLNDIEKAPWYAQQVQDKVRYEQEHAAWQPVAVAAAAAAAAAEPTLLSKPKRAQNAWAYFVKAESKLVRAAHPTASFKEIPSLLSKKWKSMSAEEVQPYHALAQQDKVRSSNERKLWELSQKEYAKITKKKETAKKSHQLLKQLEKEKKSDKVKKQKLNKKTATATKNKPKMPAQSNRKRNTEAQRLASKKQKKLENKKKKYHETTKTKREIKKKENLEKESEKGNGKNKGKRNSTRGNCGQCDGCLAENCGECKYCCNKKLKRKCLYRRCTDGKVNQILQPNHWNLSSDDTSDNESSSSSDESSGHGYSSSDEDSEEE